MPYYVCYNENENGYWNRSMGWVEYRLADHYTAMEARNNEPPHGGVWILVSEAAKNETP